MSVHLLYSFLLELRSNFPRNGRFGAMINLPQSVIRSRIVFFLIVAVTPYLSLEYPESTSAVREGASLSFLCLVSTSHDSSLRPKSRFERHVQPRVAILQERPRTHGIMCKMNTNDQDGNSRQEQRACTIALSRGAGREAWVMGTENGSASDVPLGPLKVRCFNGHDDRGFH